MADIYVNPFTGDIDFEDFRFTTEIEEYIQRTIIAWSLNLKEFFTHMNYGLPWIDNPNETLVENVQYFLGDSTLSNPELFISSELDRYTKTFPFVSSLTSTFDYNRGTREFKYSATILTTSGVEVNIPPYAATI